ncbi:MAG: NifB/NifX family molybdenum-iron cluster-binding protein [Candidatus Thorarchaeota archaeon]|nr:NifB/NifX family molybdenum-iron cluster-binding protein [Candidatus Thorarchaeota archaeon]
MTTRKVVIPTDDAEGKSLAGHFGRAEYFVVVELDDANRVVRRDVHNVRGEHTGGHGYTHDNIMRMNPDAVIVGGMGPRGIASFQSRGVAVLQANSPSVDELVAAYISGRLGVLTEGCHDAHHH